jgi:hypothetical protein
MTGAYLALLAPLLVAETRVDVQERRILLSETIRFDHKSATIKKASHKILDELARTLKEKTEIEVLRIEGHNDSLGVASKAMKMSEERAQAVKRHLVSKGVDEKRLLAKGYGQEWPIASNWTAAGRKLNRRVEFVLVKVQGREIGRRELPKLYGRIHAIVGTAVARAGAAEEKARILVLGSAVFPGDRLNVPAEAELTIVFPTLHFVALVGPTEAEVSKADAWSIETPISIRVVKGRARSVTTRDSSKDVAVRLLGAQTACAAVRDEKSKTEFSLLETEKETIVESEFGAAACGGGISVASPGLRFGSGAKPALVRPAPPTILVPTATKAGPGSVELVWTRPRETTLPARLEVAADPGFVAPLEVRRNADEKVKVTLAPGRYFWRVIQIGADGVWSPASVIHTFEIATEAKP